MTRSVERLVTVVIIEAHDEWQAAERRYLSEGLDGPAPAEGIRRRRNT